MDRGGVMVAELLRMISSERYATDSGQTSCYSGLDCDKKLVSKQEAERKAIKLVRRQRDLLSRAFRLEPSLSTGYVYKLFGFFGINEKAVQDPSFEESYFKTYFHGRVVERVQVYENAVLVELASPMPTGDQRSIAQIIDAYRRKGCMKFYELAAQMQQVMEIFGTMESTQAPPDKPESLKKCLDQLGDSMFVCTSGLRKVAISKALLSYLEYDIQEFCIEAVKFRGIFAELFSANSYYAGLTHMLALLKYTVQLANNQISLSQFRQLTTFRFSDFVYSKNYVRSYCDMTISLINPSLLCHKVNFVYYQEKEGLRPGALRAVEDEKERMRQSEYQVIRRIKNIPNSLLSENQQLIAGYKVVHDQTQASSFNEDSSP